VDVVKDGRGPLRLGLLVFIMALAITVVAFLLVEVFFQPQSLRELLTRSAW